MPNPRISRKTTARLRAPDGSTLQFFVRDGMLWSVNGDGEESAMLVPQVVLSVFGRFGEVVAQLNDYAAGLVDNDSDVTGDNVKDALDWLLSHKCPLDINDKVPIANLPEAILGALTYQGTWDAGTNDPALADETGQKGWYYVVSDAGTIDLGGGEIDFGVGDWAVHNGFYWEKVDATDQVTSVAGKTGNVTLVPDDIVGLDTELSRLPQPIPMIADEAIGGHRFVHIKANGRAVVADSVLGLVAHAFTPVAVDDGDTFDGFPIGSFNGFTGLTPGAEYWLAANGLYTATPPASPSLVSQHVGVAAAADKLAVKITLGIEF